MSDAGKQALSRLREFKVGDVVYVYNKWREPGEEKGWFRAHIMSLYTDDQVEPDDQDESGALVLFDQNEDESDESGALPASPGWDRDVALRYLRHFDLGMPTAWPASLDPWDFIRKREGEI